jgi:hypothetical protein
MNGPVQLENISGRRQAHGNEDAGMAGSIPTANTRERFSSLYPSPALGFSLAWLFYVTSALMDKD